MSYAEGRAIGHRWYRHHDVAPAFWFGHGLTYGTTSWGAPVVSGDISDAIEVTVPVTNEADREVREVVQVYALAPDLDDVAPFRFLASAVVDIAPGETTTAVVRVPARRVAIWADGEFRVPAGTHEIHVGRHAGDTSVAVQIDVTNDVVLSGDARQSLR
jgi:beta-glucosidase